MNKEQLKERLIVAETIMKKLYNRNKELEEYHKNKDDQTIRTNEKTEQGSIEQEHL